MPFDNLPETIPPVALVLGRAADLVERGWCRFTIARRGWSWWYDGEYRYCAIGAINQAKCELDVVDPFNRARQAVAQIAAEAGYIRVDCWNDWSLSHHRVVAGLREARDRVIAAHRVARLLSDSVTYVYSDPNAAHRKLVVA